MKYSFCSVCGGKLKKTTQGFLACLDCDFVNYLNARVTVSGLMLFRNKLLLTKRADGPFKNWWDLPGGFVDMGEGPAKAIRREIKEETGISIYNEKIFGIYTGTYPSNYGIIDIINIVYVMQSRTAKTIPMDDVSETGWFSRKALPKNIAFDSNKKIIRDFLKTWR